MSYDTLIYEQDDHVVTLTLQPARPAQRDQPPHEPELHHAWARFRDDDDAFVLVPDRGGRHDFWPAGTSPTRRDDRAPDYEEFRRSIYNAPGECGYTRRVDVFKPVIAAVNGFAFAAGLETALLADIRIAAENAEFGALERRWNIVGGDGMTVRLPLVVGYGAMELLITGRRVKAAEAERIGLANEVVPQGQALARAQELAREIAALPQGAIRSDKEFVVRGIGRTLEERLRIEAEMTISMFLRRDSQAIGASAFKRVHGTRLRWSGRITACSRGRGQPLRRERAHDRPGIFGQDPSRQVFRRAAVDESVQVLPLQQNSERGPI